MSVWDTVRAFASAVLGRIRRRRSRPSKRNEAKETNGQTPEQITKSDAIGGETSPGSAGADSPASEEQPQHGAERSHTTSPAADPDSKRDDRGEKDVGDAPSSELASVDPSAVPELGTPAATEHETLQSITADRSPTTETPAMETAQELSTVEPRATIESANPSIAVDPLPVRETEPSPLVPVDLPPRTETERLPIETGTAQVAGGGMLPPIDVEAPRGSSTEAPPVTRAEPLAPTESETPLSIRTDVPTSAGPPINAVLASIASPPEERTILRIETETPPGESALRPEIEPDATPQASLADAEPTPDASPVGPAAPDGIHADPPGSIETEAPYPTKFEPSPASNAVDVASLRGEAETPATAPLETTKPSHTEEVRNEVGAQPQQLDTAPPLLQEETVHPPGVVTEDDASAVSPPEERRAEGLLAKRAAKQARQYRPVPRTPPVQRAATTTPATGVSRTRSLRIELRLRQQLGGFFQASLVPRRDAGLPEQLTVRNGDTLTSLVALQDEWYQDVSLPDLGHSLRGGTVWEATVGDEPVSWALSGREVFVLMQHRQLSGFVSAPLMVLGERHIVLCTQDRAADVEQAIRATGAAVSSKIGPVDGLPDGWCGFRDVVPSAPVQASTGGSILDVLCPVPDVEIVIEDGIPIGRTAWLEGFPPSIRLHGDSEHAGPVQVDGKQAVFDPEQRSYSVDGWDRLGDHLVWCAGKSASYSIATGDEEWRPWEVHRWSLGDAIASDLPGRPAICGALALGPRIASPDVPLSADRVVVVPSSNPVLIGSVPGQLHSSSVRRDVRALSCTAFPAFDPIWALPPDVLHSNKETARILLVGDLVEPQDDGVSVRSRDVAVWCTQILAACKKGLRIEPASPEVARLWQQYKRQARLLWRKTR